MVKFLSFLDGTAGFTEKWDLSHIFETASCPAADVVCMTEEERRVVA